MEKDILDVLAEAGLIGTPKELDRDKMNLIVRKPRRSCGQPKTFDTAEELWSWYEKYIVDIRNNPIEVKEHIGKDAKAVYKTNYRPPNWKGFESFLFRSGVTSNLEKYRYNFQGAYDAYVGIVRAIGNDMFDIKYTGASLNLWNHNIIAKEMHLAETIEVKSFERPILENGKELPPD